jgi:hypothetical protein
MEKLGHLNIKCSTVSSSERQEKIGEETCL